MTQTEAVFRDQIDEIFASRIRAEIDLLPPEERAAEIARRAEIVRRANEETSNDSQSSEASETAEATSTYASKSTRTTAALQYRIPMSPGLTVAGACENSVQNRATLYDMSGFRIVPCLPADGKSPTRSGFSGTDDPNGRASWLPAQIDAGECGWTGEYVQTQRGLLPLGCPGFQPEEEVFILCGPCRAVGPKHRLLGLDLDKAMDRVALEGLIGKLPETLTSKGWRHAYYRIPADSPLYQRNGLLRVPGGALDIRPNIGGGLAEFGAWDGVFDPSRIVDLPEHAHAALVAALGERTHQESAPVRTIAGAKQLSGNDALIVASVEPVWQKNTTGDLALGALGGVLYRGGVSRERAESILSGLATATKSTHADPIGRGLQAYDGKHNLGWPKLREALTADGARVGGDGLFDSIEARVDDALADVERLIAESVDEPEIVEIGPPPAESVNEPEPPAPSAANPLEFPLDAMPTAVRAWLGAMEERFRVPIDLVAQAALGAMSAAVQGNVTVRVENDYDAPTGLYNITAAEPGVAKSPIFKAAFRPIDAWARARAEALRPELAKARTERMALEERRTAVTKLLKDCEKESAASGANGIGTAETIRATSRAPKLKEELTALSLQLAAPKPQDYRYTVADITPAALVQQFAAHGRLACVSGEGHEIFQTITGRRFAGKGSSAQGSDLHIILEAYDGNAVETDRKGADGKGETIRAESANLAISLAVQPDVLLEAAHDRELVSRGLLDRFAAVLCSSRGRGLSSENDTPTPVPEYVTTDYDQLLGRMCEVRPGTVVKAQPGVRELWGKYRYHMQLQAGPGGEFQDAQGWAVKHAYRAVRLAGILAVAKGESAISVETMSDAIRVCEWWSAHARVIFGRVPEHEIVNEVVEFVRGRPDGKTTGSAILARFKRALRNMKEVQEVLGLAAAGGAVHLDKGKRGGLSVTAVAGTA